MGTFFRRTKLFRVLKEVKRVREGRMLEDIFEVFTLAVLRLS